MGAILGVLGSVALVLAVVGFMTVKRFLIICQPSEVVIISGPKPRAGKQVGYRSIRGGRGWRVPLLEVINRMDLTNIVVDVAVRNAYSRDGIPLNILGVANVKIDGDPPGLDNAVERLMGKSLEEVVRLARETLEGNLRGVLARLTPEQVNEDKESFATELIEEAEVDLQRLGLVLDTLKIQTVSDDVGYLDSIGRAKNAELIRTARMAEADRTCESTVNAAENLQKTRVTQLEAQVQKIRAGAQKRIVAARSQRAAEVAKEEGTVEAAIARAEAEVEVQRQRIEQVRLQLEADVVAPAKAYRAQKEAEAHAAVASIIEDGRATALGLQQLAKSWIDAGDHARDIFLLEKLDTLVGIIVDTVKTVKVDRITFIDEAGAGTAAGRSASLVEQLRTAADIDVPKLARDLAVGLGATRRPPGPPPLPRSE